MSSLKRWRRVSQGQFHRWETPGGAFQGIWRGIRDGRFGLLGILDTEVGPVAFPLPVALRVRLVQVHPGTVVLVRYTGLQTSTGGRIFKAFDVFVAGEDALLDIPELPLHRAVADES